MLKRRSTIIAVLSVVVILGGFFFYELQPVGAGPTSAMVVFEVQQGESFRGIADDLAADGLVRSRVAFEFLAILEGKAPALQSGLYQLDPSMSSQAILDQLTNAADRAVTVVIPEGSNLFEVDSILANALVIQRGELINFKDDGNLEGMLFPDTYQFFPGSNIKDVVQKFLDAFKQKAEPLLSSDGTNSQRDLIIASILEKEVPDLKDQQVVAGIILKRLAAGMPLDIDATICYAKLLGAPTSTAGCYPITSLDKKIDSAYNTYLYKGLPPGPIGNPGTSAITAALHPESSTYWYYLSDPKTGRTVYAVTLAGQEKNAATYLGD